MKRKVILISILILILGIITGNILYLNSGYKLNLDRKNNMLKVGREYYEDYYYPSVGLEYVKRYKDTSIKIPLSTINNSNIKDKIKNKLFDKCDYDDTYVEIVPISPYKDKDYKVEVNIDC